jgi:hypothetical protein
VWFSYTATSTGLTQFATCDPAGFATGTLQDTVIQVLDSASCPPLVELGCNDDGACGTFGWQSRAIIPTTAGTTYFVRVAKYYAGTIDGTFYLTVGPVVVPANDDCAGALPLAFGANGPYDNTFATDGAVAASCTLPGNRDLWFSYVATCASVNVDTCSPVGTLTDTVLTVYDACGGIELACNDDACGLLSSTSFAATIGSTYFIRVASWQTAVAGTFSININAQPTFTLAVSNPPPPVGFATSIQLDWNGGPAFGTAALVVTFFAGAYPNGWFFGIDPTFAEVAAFLSDPAFNAFPLNACGSFTLGPFYLPAGFPFNFIPFYAVSMGTPPASAVPTVVSNPANGAIM